MSYVTPDQVAKQIGRERDVANLRMQQVCDRASFAIDDRCGRTVPFPEPIHPTIADIALSLAVDIWKQPDATFGIMGMGETGPVRTARDLVARYEPELIPFFNSEDDLSHSGWGVA